MLIFTTFAFIFISAMMSFWPPIGHGVEAHSDGSVHGAPCHDLHCPWGERNLIPFDLHPIWNVSFLFETGRFMVAMGKE